MLRRILTVALVGVGCAGCVYHLDSAIPDELLRFNPALVGTWASDDARVVITAAEDQSYTVEYHDGDEEPVPFQGRLGRLGDRDVLEIWPSSGEAEQSWPQARFLVIIDVRDDEITTWSLDIDSITAAAKRDGNVPHLSLGEDLVLTAPTPHLATTLADYLGRPGYVADGEVWRRVKR